MSKEGLQTKSICFGDQYVNNKQVYNKKPLIVNSESLSHANKNTNQYALHLKNEAIKLGIVIVPKNLFLFNRHFVKKKI